MLAVGTKQASALWVIVYVCVCMHACACVKSLLDGSLQGSFVHGDSPGKNTGGGVSCPPPEALPDPGIEPISLHMSPALVGGFLTTSTTWEALSGSLGE